MRFAANGPNIPDELLVARDEGRAVFFCGAGVSRAKAHLKDFIGLARAVADKLSIAAEMPAHQLIDAIETLPPIAGVGSLISADRVFGLIERDFLSRDIYRAIAESLKPEGTPDLTAHRLLLDLARGPDGTIRLITTNFDLLFEDCDSTIPVSRHPRIPDPLRSDDFNGIIHLHGHVTPDYSDAAGDGLIISSAEFGRAYLSERWAADFIKKVLERYFVVFVGYSADDPPMQYLLEALNRAPGSFSGAYALQSGSYEEAEARWVQKGVRPIVYDEADQHSALWESLTGWAERARNPTTWHDALLAKAMAGPEKCEPHIRGQIAHIASTSDGAKRIAQATNPIPAGWLYSFDPLIRFAEPGRTGSVAEPGPYFDPFEAYGLDSDPVPAKSDPDSDFAKRDIPSNAWNAFALTRSDRQDLQEDQVSALRGHLAIHPPRLASRVAHLGDWLQRVANQPAAIWWAASQKGIHPDIQRRIEFGIEHGKVDSTALMRKAWRYLIDTWRNSRDDFFRDYFQLVGATKLDGWTSSTVRAFAEFHKPYIEAKRAFHGTPHALNTPVSRIGELMHLDVKYPHHSEEVSVPDSLLPALVKEFRLNLELGSALEEELGGYGLHTLVGGEARIGKTVECDGFVFAVRSGFGHEFRAAARRSLHHLNFQFSGRFGAAQKRAWRVAADGEAVLDAEVVGDQGMRCRQDSIVCGQNKKRDFKLSESIRLARRGRTIHAKSWRSAPSSRRRLQQQARKGQAANRGIVKPVGVRSRACRCPEDSQPKNGRSHDRHMHD